MIYVKIIPCLFEKSKILIDDLTLSLIYFFCYLSNCLNVSTISGLFSLSSIKITSIFYQNFSSFFVSNISSFSYYSLWSNSLSISSTVYSDNG